MRALHQHLPANVAGRDFIVGDLHGCMDLLQEQLDRVSFDRTRDRLFSVGDLIDRGPDSLGCLRLLREPWFHAVRGNHEEMLLDYAYPTSAPYTYGSAAKDFYSNGGSWVLDLGKSDCDEMWQDLTPRVAKLPYVITVGEGPAQFHVAHAELMTGRADESNTWYNRLDPGKKEVLTDEQITDEVIAKMIEPITWGRRLVRKGRDSKASEVVTPYGRLAISHRPWHPGLSLTYVGHTPVRKMVLHASHLFIDRGAYTRKRRSCLLVVEHYGV